MESDQKEGLHPWSGDLGDGRQEDKDPHGLETWWVARRRRDGSWWATLRRAVLRLAAEGGSGAEVTARSENRNKLMRLATPIFVGTVLMLPSATRAAMIDNFPTPVSCPSGPSSCHPSLVSELGEQDAGGDETTASYYAQSFMLPTAGLASTLSFQIQSLIDAYQGLDDIEFRLLITDTTLIGGKLHPQTVLFESGDLSLPQGSALTTFEVNLGGLALQGGTKYFWILDSWVLADGMIGAGSVGLRSGYPDGDFYATNAGAANWPTDTGTRADHFASDPFHVPFEHADLAFRLTYEPALTPAPVPEPGSLVLVVLALSLLARQTTTLAPLVPRGTRMRSPGNPNPPTA